MDVIARIDVPARDDAVDLRDDVAIAKIEFGLSELAFGEFELGLGLLDGRRLGRQPGERAVDVALFFELLDHLLWGLVVGMDHAKLSRRLDQVRLRREDGRKGLIEIGRHLVETFAAIGLRRQSQRGANLVNFGQRLGDLCARQSTRLLERDRTADGSQPRSPASCCARSKSACASVNVGLALVESGYPSMQQGDLVVDVLDGVLQLPAPGPCLCFDIPHRGLGRPQVRLCGIDGRLLHSNRVLKWLLVEFGEKLAFVHAVVVVHQNPGDLAGDPGSDERHMAVDVGVVRRNGVERCENPRDAEYTQSHQNEGAERTNQQPPPPRGPLIRGAFRLLRLVLGRHAFTCRGRVNRSWFRP